MFIDPKNILYTIVGGVSMIIVTSTYKKLCNRFTGRDDLVKYSTFIKRHARNRREIENLIADGKHLRSIVMQGVDAAYIALAGKDPSVVILYLRKPDDARLFRACLDYLDDPEAIYAIASRQKTEEDLDEDCEECKEMRSDISRRMPEGTWFRLTHGKEATDEKIDEAMLEQVMSLAKSRDREFSQSGACHISVKLQGPGKESDILVLPTSRVFRKTFKQDYATDDLTRFPVKDLFGKILAIRRKLSGLAAKAAATKPRPQRRRKTA